MFDLSCFAVSELFFLRLSLLPRFFCERGLVMLMPSVISIYFGASGCPSPPGGWGALFEGLHTSLPIWLLESRLGSLVHRTIAACLGNLGADRSLSGL